MGFEDVNQPPHIIESLKRFSENPQGFIVLAGTNGTGKSFAAHAVYNSFMTQDSDDKKFISQSNLNIAWLKQFAEWGETNYLLNQYLNHKLLILDDIGTRTPTESFMDFLYSIVDSRYENRHRQGTIITTNLNSADMRQKFGDAFTSRVASGLCFRIDGKDRRFIDF